MHVGCDQKSPEHGGDHQNWVRPPCHRNRPTEHRIGDHIWGGIPIPIATATAPNTADHLCREFQLLSMDHSVGGIGPVADRNEPANSDVGFADLKLLIRLLTLYPGGYVYGSDMPFVQTPFVGRMRRPC